MKKTPLKLKNEEVQRLQKRRREIVESTDKLRGKVVSFTKDSRIAYLKHVSPLNINVFYTLGFGHSIATDYKLKEKAIRKLRTNIPKKFPNSYHVWRLEPRLTDGEPHLHVLATVLDDSGNYICEEFCDWLVGFWNDYIDSCDEGFESPVDCECAYSEKVKLYTAKDSEEELEETKISELVRLFWDKYAGNRWGKFPIKQHHRFAIGPRATCIDTRKYKQFLKILRQIKLAQLPENLTEGYSDIGQQFYMQNLDNKSDNLLFSLSKDDVKTLEKLLFNDGKMYKNMHF